MCGIAGLRRFDGRSVDEALLTRMADLLRHRGPDEHRVRASGPVGLVHTRLSITDLAGVFFGAGRGASAAGSVARPGTGDRPPFEEMAWIS